MCRFRNHKDLEQSKRRTAIGSLARLLVIIAVGLSLFSKTANGITLQDSNLLECLSDDTLAVIIISDPTAVINCVHECLSGSDEWKQFASSFGEEYSAYVTQTQLDGLMESFGRLDRAMRDFESVSIVLHSFKAGHLNFSLVVESTDEQFTAFQREISLLWATYSETKLHEKYSKSISELFGRLKHSKVDRFHVFSASDNEPQISIPQQHSLLKLRAFRRGWNQIVQTPWDVAIYFSPRRATELAELYLKMHPENALPGNPRVALPEGFDDIVCLCTSIDLNSDSKHTRALIRSFLCFTVPRSGVAQVWQSYPAISEYPYLPFSVFEFKALGNPYNKDTGFGANFSARMLIETSKTTPPKPSAVYFDEVVNHDAAKRYVERLQQNARGLPADMRMREVQTDGSVWMAKETDEYARRQITEIVEQDEQLRILNEEQVTRLMEYVRQTRVLDSKWHILGYAGDISDLLEPGEVDSEDYGSFIKKQVTALASRTQSLSEPFAVEAYSPLSYNVLWMVHGYFWPNRPSNEAKGLNDNSLLPRMAKLGINAIARRHGNQLWMYSQNASMMQVDVEVFASPEWLFPDATEKFGERWFGKGYGGW